jgi:uncharacterized protein
VAGPVGPSSHDQEGATKLEPEARDPEVRDPELIERLRRSGIRIDGQGDFQHEGAPVRHEGLRRALFRWLDRLPDGRTVLRLDAARFAYVDVDDTPLVARAARLDGDRVLLALTDGAEEPLDPATLTIDGDGVLRCWVRGGRLEARLATSAAAVLADLISDGPGRPALTLAGRIFPVADRPPAARR